MTTTSANESPVMTVFSQLAQALRAEQEKLQTKRNAILFFGGEFVGSFAGYFYYRFEVPEDLHLRPVDRVSCVFNQLQPVTIDGKLVSVENQYVVLALPMDFGSVLPEIRCEWNYDDHLPQVISQLEQARAASPVASLIFQPGRPENTLPGAIEPPAVPGASSEQTEALRRVLKNRVSYLWGPTETGKTKTLALAALAFLKAGKSVLLTAPTADQTDQLFLRTLALAKDLGVDLDRVTARVGLPADPGREEFNSCSFELEVELQRTDKKKQLEERVTLLRTYWKTKVHQYLHDDYFQRLNELRDRTNDHRKQLDKVRDEIAALKDTITRAQNASMIEKLKKGFSKEEAAAAQKQLIEKQGIQRKLQPVFQALTAELMRVEAQAPIDSNEMKEYQLAVKRIGELGGIKNVIEEVDALSAVDESALLGTKRCVASTVTNIFSDPRLRGKKFDHVLVDDAERVPEPYLAALALSAGASIIVAGDPYQQGPESYSKSNLAQTWLQQDVFLHLAQTEELGKLPDWARQNASWCIPLTSQFTSVAKLSRFRASTLFDNAINNVDRPGPNGKIVVVDTSDLKSVCRQYLGKKSLVPFNELQTKRTVEIVKHLLGRGQKQARDVGIVIPFQGTTLYTKLQLRLQGIRNVEVGTPSSFQGRRKSVILLDLTMAGVDYTMRSLDDRKIGEHRIIRLLNAVFSSVQEDLYVVVDLSHFKSVYKDRIITKVVSLLVPQSDGVPPLSQSTKYFDEMGWDVRERIMSLSAVAGSVAPAVKKPGDPTAGKSRDAELEIRMKMMAKQQTQQVFTGRDFEQEIYLASIRVLGLRKDTNLLSQYLGGDLLFRHSLGTEEAAAQLPLDSCHNDDEFRRTMERWNLLIYEMSGAGKTDLSLFAKQTPEARVRWDINNLRAYYSSAMEAIVEESKHRIATSVSKVFQECLGKSQPANPIEWSTAYINFLGKMEAYLSWISEQLRH